MPLTQAVTRVITGISLVAVFYAIVFRFVIAGGPFQEVRQFISTSAVVADRLGEVHRIDLSWTSSGKVTGSGGEAHLKCFVEGAKGRGAETTVVSGRTSTTVFDGSTRPFTSTTPAGRTSTSRIDPQSRVTRTLPPW